MRVGNEPIIEEAASCPHCRGQALVFTSMETLPVIQRLATAVGKEQFAPCKNLHAQATWQRQETWIGRPY